MPEMLKKIPQQFANFWKNMDKGNRNKIIIMSVVVFASVIICIYAVTKPQYELLFSSSLDLKEIGEVKDKLDDLHIKYKLSDDGSYLLVPTQDVAKARVALAQDGIPKRGITFEELNKTRLGITDAERKRNYRYFLESALANDLANHIEEIEDAKVTLTMPEKSKFIRKDDEPAKASVIINSYNALTPKQVKGIQRYIASGVENLDAENVTVLDDEMNIISNVYDDTYGEMDRKYQVIKVATADLENRVRSLLSSYADNVRVMASLAFDFDSEVLNQEIYEPGENGKGLIRSSEETKESVTNGTSGGAPGTDSNPPQYPNNVSSGSDNAEYNKSDEIINYEINKTIRQYTKELGKMMKDNSSVAVSLEYLTQPEVTDGSTANAQKPKSNVDEIINIVSTATGIPTKNINVNVVDLPLLSESQPSVGFMEQVGNYAPIILVGILILLLAIAILKRKSPESKEEQKSTGYTATARNDETLPEIDLEEKSKVKRQIENFVKQKPEAVAQLLRNWLSEDWD